MKIRPVLVLAALALALLTVLGLAGVQPCRDWLALLGLGSLAAGGGAARPNVKKIKEATRDQVLAQDPSVIVDSLDPRARAGIERAKQAGVDAGVDAARAALYGGRGPRGGPDLGADGS